MFLGLTRALFFPHSLLSTSPTFTLELLREFRWLAGARGKAVVRVVAADQAGNVKLERGVRGAFLGFRHDSRFFGSSIAFLSCLTCSCGAAVGPFVRDCKAERLFLCCVVRVGYWLDQLVVCSRVVASFFLTRALPLAVVREFVTRGRGLTSSSYVSYPLRDIGPFAGGRSGYGALMGINNPIRHSWYQSNISL
ncbi:hypothetical protein Taro_017791 [Colocasia esculenta]|uniref:Uncharacterized protein n=1 Tax=Colocasia esculenta TaxID=4460 RepID=A0A843UP26_COLES|nr:hypothetical protein [Colocasia esculenta]